MPLLEGVRVIELSTDAGIAACGRVLACWKAEVIKVETGQDADCDICEKLFREVLDSGKKTIKLDLETNEGQACLDSLLAGADVFLTGFAESSPKWPVPDYKGLSAKYPSLIYATLNAYGSRGKLSDVKGTGAISFWARSGFTGFFGEPDAPPVSPLPGMDTQVSGTFLANGVAAALIGRIRTGRGERVETSMYHAAIWAAGLFNATSNYWENPRKTRKRPDAPLINSFCARDGKWFYTAIMEHERHWPLLCACLDRPDLAENERFSVFRNAVSASSELTALLDDAFATKDRSEWLALLKEKDIPVGAIFDAHEVLEDIQAEENGYIECCTDEDGHSARVPSPPTHFIGDDKNGTA